MKYLIAVLLIALTSSLAATIPLGTPLTLKLGATLTLRNWSLTFVRVVSDSRCPPKVQCVWAGDATLELRIKRGQTSQIVELHTGLEPRSAVVLGQRLTLIGLGVKPAKSATFKISQP